ncbi:MAG: 50S ribosome-binding GTPase [Pseudomonadota bacterium]
MLQKFLYLLFILLFLSVTAVFLWLSDLFLSVWDKLLLQPEWFFWSYIAVFTVFILFTLIMLFRLLPRSIFAVKQNHQAEHKNSHVEDLKIDQIEDRVQQLQQKNVDIQSIKEELYQLKNTGSKQDIRIVLFGDISSGKSSLINALLPKAQGEVSVTGGTTQEVTHYQWISPLGESVIVTDTPGFDEHHRLLDEMSLESVFKAHIAIYLCEGDLTASQYQQIKEVALVGKPLLVAFNKTDRYVSKDIDIIVDKLRNTLDSIDAKINLVQIKTGGIKEVTLLYPDGSEKVEQRKIPADLTKLLKSITNILAKTSPGELESTRQKAVLHLLSSNLDKVEQQLRIEQSQSIIKSSTKKAVIAAMATITPGSDLLVQGYLAVAMIKDLCKVYDVPVKEVDVNKLLSLLQSDTIGVFPLLLGVAGNGFKAFPGPGTLAGGVLHAVAYGLIFDSVGKAVNLSLSTQGDLIPILVEDIYKEKLVENIESRALELVKMVIKSKTDS